jgi:hypothetical protein
VTGKPLWRSGFDRLERGVGAPLERFVQTTSFARAATTLLRVESVTRHTVERRLGQFWHVANLPTRTDVAHLRGQVSQLDRQLEMMRSAAEDARKDGDRAEPSLSPPPADTG